MNKQGYIKITDLGISTKLDAEGLCKERSGTYGYMAPEVINGKPHGIASDAWAIGSVLFEFLTTKRLYELGGKSDSARKNYFKNFEPTPIVQAQVSGR